ncbi:MAG: cyclic nucleotide-binding domain-containing protein, partial [Spartobacteria bacterium]
ALGELADASDELAQFLGRVGIVETLHRHDVLCGGELEARRTDNDNTIVLGKIHSGEWMGEVDLIDQASPVCSVVATKRTQYWVMSRGAFDAFVHEFPEDGVTLLHSISEVLCRRIRDVTRKLAWRSLIS